MHCILTDIDQTGNDFFNSSFGLNLYLMLHHNQVPISWLKGPMHFQNRLQQLRWATFGNWKWDGLK